MTGDPDVPAEILTMSQLINAPNNQADQLEQLVHLAKAAMPEIDHVGVSVAHSDGRVETKAATSNLVDELDQLQYALGDGPWIHAISDEPRVKVEHASQDPRWPEFMSQAVARGLRSQLAIRLYIDERERGGLNLYSTTSDTIDAETEHFAEFFASHAAQALGRVRAQENLDDALSSCRTIGTAIGVVMERYQLDPDRAFIYLTRVASSSEIKLRTVAAEVVAETSKQSRNGTE